MKASIVSIAALDSRWRFDIEVEPIRHTPNLVALVLFVLLISLVRFIIATIIHIICIIITTATSCSSYTAIANDQRPRQNLIDHFAAIVRCHLPVDQHVLKGVKQPGGVRCRRC